jgi:cysteine desulfurase
MAVYLDHNATAPIRPEAREAAICALDIGGNPSSVHANGRLARAAVEKARSVVAALVGAGAEAVTFTSGGTEANDMAIHAAIAAGSKKPIVLMTEHPSTLATASSSGLWTEAWPVSANGLAGLDWLRDRLKTWRKEDGPPFAVLSLANHETGVIQNVMEAAAIVHDAGGWLHVDAVQAAGKIAVDVRALGADTLSLSGHKLGAPQGVGALIAGPRAKLQRGLMGAQQERGFRPGTENLAGIAGFGAAAKAALRYLSHAGEQAPWRDAAAERLKDVGCIVAGEAAPRLPGVLCTVYEGWESQLQVMALDLAGVMVSAGSACSSGKVTPSHVLAAMKLAGMTENFAKSIQALTATGATGVMAGYGLRASGGWATTQQDWTAFADAWLAAHDRWSARRKVA